MRYIHACVLLLVMTGGCSRHESEAYSLNSLVAYSTIEQPHCRNTMTLAGGLSGKCNAAAVTPTPQPIINVPQTLASVAPTGTPQ